MSTAADPELARFDERIPWVEPAQQDFARVTQTIASVTENPQPAWWWPAFAVSSTLLLGGVLAACYLISTGVGVWGSNIPVGWAFDITNFVFWIGIGHAGTLISAILFLFRQKWRTAINRYAEAMTLFAVMCAGVYPGIHVGRFWYAWFMFPVPNANHIWQNFRSALCWDLFAVGTYFTVSVLFWYTGLIPDLATLRDRATTKYRKCIFAFLSFGWRGSARHWRHYEIAYLLLAGFSTPLVLSVHSVVSFDFATAVIPGWHTTIFPPYFVAGAIFGGFAMVLQCMIPVRTMYPGLKDIVTIRHLDVMAKFILATGSLVAYAYAMEFFIAWYSGNPYEMQIFVNRATGDYWWAYWSMLTCNLFVPQLLWMKSWRTTPGKLLIVVTFVNVGMWWERFVIIVQSLHRDYLPANWGNFTPSWVDWLQMVGDFGLFFTLTLLFMRYLPMISMAEIKGVLPGAHPHGDHPPTFSRDAESSERSALAPTALITTADGGSGEPWGLVAQFRGPAELMRAAATLRDAGYTTLDAYTPYPVHGLVKAIGKRRSPLPWITLCGAIFGLGLAIFMQFYLMGFYYPTIVQDKQFTSWEAFVPIMFELMVLFSAFFTVFGMLWLCGLPRYFHPIDQYDPLARATDDGFFLSVEAKDPQYDTSRTRAALEQMGGYNVAVVEG
jgi:Ni/Fe-hydrogenase subunit HybB-like protein